MTSNKLIMKIDSITNLMVLILYHECYFFYIYIISQI
jgi:hypothetical protein